MLAPKAKTFALAIVTAFISMSAHSADDLYISQPLNGTVISSNGAFQIVVRQRDGLAPFYFDKIIVVLGSRGLSVSSVQTADPYIFYGQLPAGAIGTYKLTAIGVRVGMQPVQSKAVTVSALSPVFVSMKPVVESIGIKYPGAKGAPLSAIGVTANGVEVSIPSALIGFFPERPDLVDIADGVPTGKRTGSTGVRLEYGSLSTNASVNVGALSIVGDFDENGSIDGSDLDILKRSINSRAVSLYDARDLNRDGKIDALDLRILTTLCTRPRCAAR